MLVALTCSTLVLSAMWFVYFALKKADTQQHLLQNQMESDTFITALLTKKIHQTGFFGCRRAFPKVKFIFSRPYLNSKTATDTLTLRYGDTWVSLLKKMVNRSIIDIANDSEFFLNDQLVIADCHSIEFFKIKQIKIIGHHQFIETDHPLNRLYNKQAQVGFFKEDTFFVSKENSLFLLTTTLNNNKITNKFTVNSIDDKPIELIKNVSDLTIYFAIQKAGTLVELPASMVNNSEIVRGVSFVIKVTPQNSFSSTRKVYIYAALPFY